jgi:hypothetical protein
VPTAQQQVTRMAIICASAFVVLNITFYFLSGSYFESHRTIVAGVGAVPAYTPDQMQHVQLTLLWFTGVIAAFSFVSGLAPRVVGHVIPVVFGVIDLIAAFVAFSRDAPAVLGTTLLVCGILLPLLAWHSYRGSRPAWAFLIAMCGTFAVVELFGAPKVRGALEVGLWTTMILPGLKVVAVAALASLRGAYVERGPA